jgi:Septum formation
MTADGSEEPSPAKPAWGSPPDRGERSPAAPPWGTPDGEDVPSWGTPTADAVPAWGTPPDAAGANWRETLRANARSKGAWAWGATAILALGAIAFTSVDSGAGDQSPTPQPAVQAAPAGASTLYEDLKPGDCLLTNPDGSIDPEVRTVDCAQTHDEEVVGVFDIPSASWLAEDADGVQVRVENACTSRLEVYVGASADPATMTYYSPDKDDLANGDRRVVCADETPGMTTSVRNSAP